jgi:hypothetical protein
MLTNAVAPDKLGGLERYVRELSAELVHRGVGVEVLAKQVDGSPTREMGADGVKIRRYRVARRSSVLFAPTYPFRSATAVRRALRERRRGTVLHAHFAVPALPLALARERFHYT